MPTTSIIERCKLLTERCIDDSIRVLMQATVISQNDGNARLAIFHEVGQLVYTVCFDTDMRKQMIQPDSVQVHDN
jgi:spore germination protein GerM